MEREKDNRLEFRKKGIRSMSPKSLQHMYPVGTRVQLIFMDDLQSPAPGTQGTVLFVDDMGTIHVHWDTGSTLGLVMGADSFKRL